MPTASCDWTKYKSSKIVWDNQSLIMNYPNIINYSVESTQGQAYSITWDTNRSHIITNPSNYSYSLVLFGKWIVNVTYSITGGGTGNGTYYITSPTLPTGSATGELVNVAPYTPRGAPNTSQQQCITQPYTTPGQNEILFMRYRFINHLGNQVDYIQSTGRYLYYVYALGVGQTCCVTGTSVVYVSGTYTLRIVDNGVTYGYSITNTNSIQTTYSQASKKININGRKFDLINESSIQLSCINPIQEHCAKGLIECECGNELCCYKTVNHGWQLVNTIPKVT